METYNFKNKFKQYVLEFLVPVDKEIITLKKMHTAAVVKLLVIVPSIYLLTLSTLLTYKKSAYNESVSRILLYIWFFLFFVYLISNTLIIISKNIKMSKILTYLCVFLEIASNHICLYSVGTLASHIVIFFIICVCIYRVFFDYYISLFCSIICSFLYIATAILEFCRIIPLSPYLASPLTHQVYSNFTMAFSFITAVVAGIFITFFAVNFSMNQILKLNRYIMENWKSDINSLNEFTQNTTAATDIDDIIDLTLKAVIQTKAFDMVAFMIMDDFGRMNIRSSFGWKHNWMGIYNLNPLSNQNTLIKDMLHTKKMIIAEDPSKYPELKRIADAMNIISAYIFPLIINDDLFGMLFVTNTEAKTISEHQMQMLTGIMDQANIALQNLITLVREIKKSSTDGLTGLYNRRYFDEQLNIAINESHIKNTVVSLIMMDIDNFKKYNDTYGHPAGDYLLKKLAETASKCVRSKDIVARYGGEEFVVILANTNTATALSIAERIRSSVENMSDERLSAKVTISVGVGTLQKDYDDPKLLIDFTDKSLYYAKHNGKNRVCYGWIDDHE